MLDPQMLQSMMGSTAGSEMDPRMAQLKRQQRMAEMLRGSALSTQNRGPGAAPMINQIMQGVMAGKMDRDNDAQLGRIGQEQGQMRSQNLDQLLMALRRQIPGSNTAMLPPDGMEDQ